MILSASADGALSPLKTFERVSAVSAPVHASDQQYIGLVEVVGDGAVQLQYVAVGTGAVVASEGPVKGAGTRPGSAGASSGPQVCVLCATCGLSCVGLWSHCVWGV